MQAKITSSEQQIKDLTDRVEDLERLNEQLATRARDLEVAAHVAAQNTALAGVCPLLPLPASASVAPQHLSLARHPSSLRAGSKCR